MKRESRRDFFGRWLGKGPHPEPAGLPASGPPAAAAAYPAPGGTSGFSLEGFYAARTPQRLPPISIRPSVLHYAQQTTTVGSPPPHAPPALDGDPVYAQLSAGLHAPAGQAAAARELPARDPSGKRR